MFNRSPGTVWHGNADGFLVKSFSLGLDERNRPVYQMLSLHVLFKPAKALSISCACIERLTCPATAKIG